MSAAWTWRAASSVALAWLALGCTDVAVIGESSACGTSCAEGLVCNPVESRCVQCMSDDECEGEAPLCSSVHECVQCLAPDDCAADETCRTGECVPREDDEPTDSGEGDDDHALEPWELGSDDHGGETDSSQDASVEDASVEDASADDEEASEDHGL